MIVVFALTFMGFVAGGLSYDDKGSGNNDKQCVQQELRKRECHSIVDGDTVVDVCHDRTDYVKITCGK